MVNKKILFGFIITVFTLLLMSCSESIKVDLKHRWEVNYGHPLTIVILGQTKETFMKTTIADVMQKINEGDVYRMFIKPISHKEIKETYLVPMTNKKGFGFYFLFLKNSSEKQWKRFVSMPSGKFILIDIKNNHIVSFKAVKKENLLDKLKKLNPFLKKSS